VRQEASLGIGGFRALIFDTGGTILDWFTGFTAVFETAGGHGLKREWAALARELRRRSLKAMLNQGASKSAAYTSDHAHRSALRELLAEHELSGHFSCQGGRVQGGLCSASR
jgi:2-haloacid dehalogenase